MIPALGDGVIVLRRWELSDAPVLVAAWNDVDVAAGSVPPDDRSESAAIAWIEGTRLREEAAIAIDLVAANHADNLAVGEVGISSIDQARGAALIGWWVSAGHRRNRVATRSVRLFADWLLDSGPLDHLLAEIDPGNVASARVALNSGFRLLRDSDGTRPSVFIRDRGQSQ